MQTKRNLSLNSFFKVFGSYILTSNDYDVLNNLYSNITSKECIEIYKALNNYLIDGDKFVNESVSISHEVLLHKLDMTLEEFTKSIKALEGIGLIVTYSNGTDFIYSLKRVLSAEEFCYDDTLLGLLRTSLTKTEFEQTLYPMIIRKTSLVGYKNISTNFNDSFEKTPRFENEFKGEVPDLGITSIKVKNKKLDINELKLSLLSKDFPETILKDKEFITDIERISFLYDLTLEETVEACLYSLVDNNFDLKYFRRKVFEFYDNKNNKHKFTPVSTSSKNKLGETLERLTPTKLVEAKFKFLLTSSEVEMFDKLLKNTGISVGMLNAVILKVVNDKDGNIPSYKYFEKVIATMVRSGARSVDDALVFINTDYTKTTPKTPKTKKEVPDWYKNQNNNNNNSDVSNSSDERDEEIADFFNPKKGK